MCWSFRLFFQVTFQNNMRNDNNFTLLPFVYRHTITKIKCLQSTSGRRKMRAEQTIERGSAFRNEYGLLLTFSTFEDSYQKKWRKLEGSHSPAAATVLTPHFLTYLSTAGRLISTFEFVWNAVQPNQTFLVTHSVCLLLFLKDQSFAIRTILPVCQKPQLAIPVNANRWQKTPELLPN